jgi:hypothetical protein
MKPTQTAIALAVAAGMSFALASTADAGKKQRYYGVYGVTKSGPGGGKQVRHRNKRRPHNLRCERGFYGETRCNISPNGRRFGPEAWDYATGTGQHIQR